VAGLWFRLVSLCPVMVLWWERLRHRSSFTDGSLVQITQTMQDLGRGGGRILGMGDRCVVVVNIVEDSDSFSVVNIVEDSDSFSCSEYC